jgi:uncharacterized radical SAM protein YgiQ
MSEKTVIEIAEALNKGVEWRKIKGICYISKTPVEAYTALSSFEAVRTDRQEFFRMFKLFSQGIENPDIGFFQQHGDRFLIHNPAPAPLTTEELDEIYSLDFERDAHPFYKTGEIRGLKTIRQSVTTHRGCIGQCSFCAIAVHQGRKVVSRSIESVVSEVKRMTCLPKFNGIVYDVGGPTANMYGICCMKGGTACSDRSCLMPEPCPKLRFGHERQMALLDKIMAVPGVKKVFISSGIRHDMVIADRKHGKTYLELLVDGHISGQIKIAPEHSESEVLSLMNKPDIKTAMRFKELFDAICKAAKKKVFMTYYLMAAHPGCSLDHMVRLKNFLKSGLKHLPEQVQVFTPTPSTLSTAMYYCETDAAGKRIFCEKDPDAKERQKDILKKSGRDSQEIGHRGGPGCSPSRLYRG